MSLIENSIHEAAGKQYLYKLKTRTGMFLAMAAVQVLGLLFSLQGVGSMGMGSQNLSLMVRYFSSEIIIWFTFFWIVVTAILITTREYRDFDFTFVSNRLSGNLSNIGFLVTAAVAGGITAVLGGVLLRVVVYFTHDSASLLSRDFYIPPGVLLIGIAVTVLYLLLLGAIGYFCGVLVQLNKAFVVILPGAFLGLLISGARGGQPLLHDAMDFFGTESSLALLAVKVILTVALLYAGSLLLSERLEVR